MAERSMRRTACLAADRSGRDDARGRRAGPGVRTAFHAGHSGDACSTATSSTAASTRGARAGRARPADQDSARHLQGARRPRGHPVGLVADAVQPDQHRHRSRRPDLGGRGRPLPLPSRPSTRRRPHRRAAGQGRRRQGRQHPHLRAGAGAGRAARRLGHRQQDSGRAAPRPHRLYRRRPQSEVRSGRGQARSAADRVHGRQPRPLAALGDGRSRRQVGVQLRQLRRDVHRQVRQDVPDFRCLSSGSGRSLQEPAQPGRVRRQAERRRARVRGRVHGADEPRRHQRGDHRLRTIATATSSRSPRWATCSRTTTTTRRLPASPG